MAARSFATKRTNGVVRYRGRATGKDVAGRTAEVTRPRRIGSRRDGIDDTAGLVTVLAVGHRQQV